MWSNKLKINKQLQSAMEDLGYSSPKEVQEKSMSRIAGGQDLVIVGPEGIGKTTTYVLSVIMKLKYAFEEAPRALILVPDKERVLSLVDKIQALSKNTSLRTLGVFSGVGMEPHLDALADGVDILVGTPDRVRAIYLKLALNVNKITLFILDDADLMIKQGQQLPITELARSLPKCQHLVFTQVMHDKLAKVITPFLNFHSEIEIAAPIEPKIDTYSQLLYHVPNFKTKLNLLNQLMSDEEKYKKVIVLVNTKVTAEKVYLRLKQRIGTQATLSNTTHSEEENSSIVKFRQDPSLRVLVTSFENQNFIPVNEINFIVFFELPQEKEKVIDLIERRVTEKEENPVFITFATDIELTLVKKIEHETGTPMTQEVLPSDLLIEQDAFKSDSDVEKKPEKETEKPSSGAAFHEKKESNAKQYNYGFKDKQKMSGKISKRRNS